jgi:hypothetical protein
VQSLKLHPVILDRRRRRCALVLVHNHPSGDPSPTPEDVTATERLAIVAELIGLPLLDHVIVGDPGHASLRDLRLMSAEDGTTMRPSESRIAP